MGNTRALYWICFRYTFISLHSVKSYFADAMRLCRVNVIHILDLYLMFTVFVQWRSREILLATFMFWQYLSIFLTQIYILFECQYFSYTNLYSIWVFKFHWENFGSRYSMALSLSKTIWYCAHWTNFLNPLFSKGP